MGTEEKSCLEELNELRTMPGRMSRSEFGAIQSGLCERNPYGLWPANARPRPALFVITDLVAEVCLLHAEIQCLEKEVIRLSPKIEKEITSDAPRTVNSPAEPR